MAHGMTDHAIATTGLRKSYADKVVLDGIDLNAASGATFSLLGPDGAGKTTMGPYPVHVDPCRRR